MLIFIFYFSVLELPLNSFLWFLSLHWEFLSFHSLWIFSFILLITIIKTVSKCLPVNSNIWLMSGFVSVGCFFSLENSSHFPGLLFYCGKIHTKYSIWTTYKCAVKCHWVPSLCCITITTIHLQNFYIFTNWNSLPINNSLPFWFFLCGVIVDCILDTMNVMS